MAVDETGIVPTEAETHVTAILGDEVEVTGRVNRNLRENTVEPDQVLFGKGAVEHEPVVRVREVRVDDNLETFGAKEVGVVVSGAGFEQ